MATIEVRKRPECSYCGQVVFTCRECHKSFTPGEEIECVDDPHEGLPWVYKHYCKSCAEDRSDG